MPVATQVASQQDQHVAGYVYIAIILPAVCRPDDRAYLYSSTREVKDASELNYLWESN